MIEPKSRNFDDSYLTETQISSENIFDGCVISVFRDKISLPNGNISTREVVRHKGAVCVVPITETKEILAVRQYRYALGKVTLEIPAGKLDPGESPEDCALRELSEETGYTANKLIPLGKLYTSPGFCDEVIYMYAAYDLEQRELSPDEDEFLTLTRIPAEQFENMIMSGKICDAKTQTAVLKALSLRQSESF